MPGWGAAVGGVVSALGASKQNRENAEEARKNRRFQERMSNTAVQRRMADMKLGGINPLLAAKHEASTPGGATAAPMKNILEGAPAAAATAANIALTKATTEKVKKDAELVQANIDARVPITGAGQVIRGLKAPGQALIEGAHSAFWNTAGNPNWRNNLKNKMSEYIGAEAKTKTEHKNSAWGVAYYDRLENEYYKLMNQAAWHARHDQPTPNSVKRRIKDIEFELRDRKIK